MLTMQPGHCFNRIHVDDIVGAVLASVARPSGEGGRVYNVVDDLPAPQVRPGRWICF
jgi:nucleoside-diphosphate-sugar epimerase